jgi:hypothetical protein
MKSTLVCVAILALAILTGCASAPPKPVAPDPNWPRSILVMPPLNHSIEPNAPYTYLSTISRPLAEKGYYVFPVAVIDQLLKDNGLPTPDEMNAIPLDKIRQHTGADAVLYGVISDWGQKFQVITSSTVVSVHLRLVDTRTGAELWQGKVHGRQNSDSHNGGLLGAVVNAVANQVAGSISDQTPQLARSANYSTIYGSGGKGLPDGFYRWPQTAEP